MLLLGYVDNLLKGGVEYPPLPEVTAHPGGAHLQADAGDGEAEDAYPFDGRLDYSKAYPINDVPKTVAKKLLMGKQ
jgi:hypothetical protein